MNIVVNETHRQQEKVIFIIHIAWSWQVVFSMITLLMVKYFNIPILSVNNVLVQYKGVIQPPVVFAALWWPGVWWALYAEALEAPQERMGRSSTKAQGKLWLHRQEIRCQSKTSLFSHSSCSVIVSSEVSFLRSALLEKALGLRALNSLSVTVFRLDQIWRIAGRNCSIPWLAVELARILSICSSWERMTAWSALEGF